MTGHSQVLHGGQKLSAPRKRRRQTEKRKALLNEAVSLGVSVTDLQARKFREGQQIIADVARKAAEAAKRAREEYESRWGSLGGSYGRF